MKEVDEGSPMVFSIFSIKLQTIILLNKGAGEMLVDLRGIKKFETDAEGNAKVRFQLRFKP